MGKPTHFAYPQAEYIGLRRQTRGTETSQYPEEEKTKVIAQVVASERAEAQTDIVAMQSSGL